MSSRLGSLGLFPYTDDEEEYTTRFALSSRAATNTFSVPVTLAAFEAMGSATERGTEGIAPT